MSDPNFQEEEAAPPQPPRPTKAQRQLEADEMYARQLAEHFQASERGPRRSHDDRGPPLPVRNNSGRLTADSDEREHSFFDGQPSHSRALMHHADKNIVDDLPVIKENVRKGFLETQTKVNKWISDFRKRIDGDEDDPYMGPPRMESPPRRQDYGPSQSEQLYGIRKSTDIGRKSTDRERYDADPHVLDDDFTALELRDEEGIFTTKFCGYEAWLTSIKAPHAHRASSSGRPLANADLFKPNISPPQSGPVDEVDAADRKIQRQPSPGSASKSAKWQPLTSVAPHPEADENDPFSLGDSDDEKEFKSKDIREADSARLKEAARNSISGESGEPAKGLQPSERSGSLGHKDKEAEALLTGKKA